MDNWWKIAVYAENAFGTTDWHERSFTCPECGEPIFEDDWENRDLKVNDAYICPICENIFFYEGGDY